MTEESEFFKGQEKKPVVSEESKTQGRVKELESYWFRNIRKSEKLTKL